MIPQEYTSTLFNTIAFHDPYFDRVPAEDFGNISSSKDFMYPLPDTFPAIPIISSAAPYRRMSADTQTSSADSASIQAFNSPDAKPTDKVLAAAASVVLPPIQDLPRALSPDANSSDASSTRSPPWPQQQQQHQQQSLHSFQFPPIVEQAPSAALEHRRPQLHINPDQQQPQRAHAYPTPATASNAYASSANFAPFARTAHHQQPVPRYTAQLPAQSAPAQGQPRWEHHDKYSPRDEGNGNGYEPLMLAPHHSSYPLPHLNHRHIAPPPPPSSQNQPQAQAQAAAAVPVTTATLAAAVGTQQRRRGKLPKPVTEFLKKWLLAHTDHPYPTEDEKKWLCSETGLSMSQVSNWMINARRRILAPAAKANAAATTTTPYYARNPPVRTVSGSSADTQPSPYGTGNGYTHAPSRRESYAPYPSPAARANSHSAPSHHQYSSSYPPPPSASTNGSYPGYHYQSGTPVSAPGASVYSNSTPTSAPASATLAPFGDRHEATNGSSHGKSPSSDYPFGQQ